MVFLDQIVHFMVNVVMTYDVFEGKDASKLIHLRLRSPCRGISPPTLIHFQINPSLDWLISVYPTGMGKHFMMSFQ